MKMEAQKQAQAGAQGVAGAAAGGSAHPEGEDENKENDDALPHYIGMLWNVTVIDIVETIREVVMKVCNDKSVEEDVRKKRAHAVRELGEIWQGLKSTASSDGATDHDGNPKKSVRSMYASAAAAAMEAALNKAQKEAEEQESKKE